MPRKPAQFSIPDQELDELSKMAESFGVSRSEIVRQGIRLYGVVKEGASQGDKIFLEKRDGEKQRLVLV